MADAHRSTQGRGRSARPTPADYVPAAEVRRFLTSSLPARQHRLAAEDMFTTAEAARLVGSTRATIHAWISKGRAIGLTHTKRGLRLPRWQFGPRLWEAVPHLSKALGTTEGWALLSFLESPHGALGGRTPRAAIEGGEAARVIAIAGAEGT